MPTEDSPPTCSVDSNVIASIRQTIAKFIQRCGLQYTLVVIDQALYTECCQEAINRGFPMSGGDYSIRSYMGTGVAMSSIAYGHLADHATGMWICLFTAVGICIDDTLNRGQKMDHLYHFNEYETKDMEVSKEAPSYPEYSRLLSGLAHGFGFFVFPSMLPLREYIQCMPDLIFFSSHAIDILSYYKEKVIQQTTSHSWQPLVVLPNRTFFVKSCQKPCRRIIISSNAWNSIPRPTRPMPVVAMDTLNFMLR